VGLFLGFRFWSIEARLFFVLPLSENDARVVEAIEAVVEAAELAAFSCDVKEAICKCPTADMAQYALPRVLTEGCHDRGELCKYSPRTLETNMAQDFTIINS